MHSSLHSFWKCCYSLSYSRSCGGPQVDDDFRSLSLTSIIDALPPRPLPLSKSANHPPSTCGSPNSIPLFAVGAMQPTHLSDPTVETRGDQVVYSSDERLGSLLVYYISAVGQNQTVKHQTEASVGRLWTLALCRSPHPCDHGRCGIHQSQNTACYSHPISRSRRRDTTALDQADTDWQLDLQRRLPSPQTWNE
ncbi:hypothetical protein LZ32DRAFT_322410 [Colletotrichum eremochloae]|nr:hypothetical protein LZ32DRAFT_322410 [Colletotrichum eremochloae]